MKKDERVTRIKNEVESMGYWLMWLGIFIVLLYRWNFAGESFLETLDIFIVWIVPSLVVGAMQAFKGLPVAPESYNSSKLKVPVISGIIAVALYLIRGGGFILYNLLAVFLIPFLFLLALYFVWDKIYKYWYNKNLS